MAQFNYQDYESVVAKAQTSGGDGNSQKIGYFKLADGEEALVRINVSSVDQILFATVHKPIFGRKYEGLSNAYAGISCHNELGSYSDNCPLCKAVAAKHPVIGKAEKKCFIPMLVSYKDQASGQWSEPVAVVWERPASYAREIATKLQNYGDLTQVLLKMTRVGGGKETRYSLDYAVPTIFKPEMIPADFSIFDNFKVNKHSYWELTKEEIDDYLRTGEFHVGTNTSGVTSASTSTSAPAAPAADTGATAASSTKFTSFSF